MDEDTKFSSTKVKGKHRIPVRIAWSTRSWLLSISTILMSAGTLQPTNQKKKEEFISTGQTLSIHP